MNDFLHTAGVEFQSVMAKTLQTCSYTWSVYYRYSNSTNPPLATHI